jgi:hypothetical protein
MLRSGAIIREAPWPMAGVLLLAALLPTGCASVVAIRVPKACPDTACIMPAPDRDVLVGMAISGGCSWAALFGAASLEALGQLRHTDAQWQPDLSDLPAVCRWEDQPLDSPTAVVERLA